jgi:hypothetical protein
VLDVEEQLSRLGAAVEAALLEPVDAPGVDEGLPEAVIELPRRQRRRRALLVGIAAVVVVAIVVAFVVRTETNDKRSRVISQPTSEGVFSEKTDAVLLTSDGIDGVTAIDLDHRIAGRRVIDGERAGDQSYRITVTGGHLVVGWGEIYAYPLSGGASKKIDDATEYIPAAESGEVWTINDDPPRNGTGNAIIHRVTVTGDVTFSADSLDTRAAQPLLGVPGGLVVHTPEGIAVWDASTGTVGPNLGPGLGPTVSNGRSLAWCVNTCTDVRVVPLAHTGSPDPPHAALGYGQQLALSNDNQRLAYLRPAAADSNDLVIRDLATGADAVVTTGLPQYGSITWSSDGKQLFYSQYSYTQPSMIVGHYATDTHRWEQNQIAVGDAVGGLVVLSPSEARSFFNSTLVAPDACPGAGGSFPSGRKAVCSFRF